MIVARPSTPASYFHLLRRQAHHSPRKPLIVFTPKAMLRLRDAASPVGDFITGSFSEVIDEPRQLDKAAVQRVIVTSGKPFHDLQAEIAKTGDARVAVVRLEQFYPEPLEALNGILATYPNAEIVWYQDEPQNQGAWPFILLNIAPHLEGRTIRCVSRPAAASPAAGSAKRHQVEADTLLGEALSF
jgi:2-oxoglutarate dehydrogenase E1 component